MRKLMFSCLKATALIEKQKHVPLFITDRWRLKLHLNACKVCKLYQIQSDIIDEIVTDTLINLQEKEIENQPLKEKIINSLPEE